MSEFRFNTKGCSGECVAGHPALQMAADLMMNSNMDYLTAFKATQVKFAANKSLDSASVLEASAKAIALATGYDKGTSGRSA